MAPATSWQRRGCATSSACRSLYVVISGILVVTYGVCGGSVHGRPPPHRAQKEHAGASTAPSAWRRAAARFQRPRDHCPSSASISKSSASVSFRSAAASEVRMCAGFVLRGMTAMPRCKAHASVTSAAPTSPCALPMRTSVGCVSTGCCPVCVCAASQGPSTPGRRHRCARWLRASSGPGAGDPPSSARRAGPRVRSYRALRITRPEIGDTNGAELALRVRLLECAPRIAPRALLDVVAAAQVAPARIMQQHKVEIARLKLLQRPLDGSQRGRVAVVAGMYLRRDPHVFALRTARAQAAPRRGPLDTTRTPALCPGACSLC